MAAPKKKAPAKKRAAPRKTKTKGPKVSKLALWKKHFLDHTNKATYLNRTASARAAGYKAKNDQGFRSIGHQNYTKLYAEIESHLAGLLTKEKVAAKIVQLMDATETKFFAHHGKVVEQEEVEALGIQVKATQLAANVKGMLRERHEVSIVGSVMDLIDGTSRGLPGEPGSAE